MNIWQTTKGTKILQLLNGRSNVFCLERDGNIILIDTGREKEYKQLTEILTSLHIFQIQALVLTHTHFDHAENAANLKEKFHPEVIVHSSESVFLFTGDSPLPRGSIFPTRVLVKLFAQRVQPFFHYKGCKSDIRVDTRFDMASFGFNAYLLHTPGHSRGSMSVIVDDEIAIVGDTMYGYIPGSVFPPFADNNNHLVLSWKKLLDSGCKTFLPANGFERSRTDLLRSYEKLKAKTK